VTAGEGAGTGASKGPLYFAGGLVAAALAFALLLFGRSAERGAFAEAYSTFRATPDGAKAAFLVLERLGYRVERHTEQALALSGVDVLFVLEPSEPGFGQPAFAAHEVRALREFVRAGGCLVVAASRETPLHEAFDVRLVTASARPERSGGEADAESKGADAPADAVPALPSVYAAEAAHLAPDARGGALEPARAAAVPIYRRAGSGGAVEAVAIREGQGKALFFADPSPFANRAIGRADNAALLASIAAAHARRGRVAFDEFHHGFAAERGIAGYMERRALGPALLQAGAAFLVLALALGGRRGRAPILDDERPPESREHVRAMAEIYAKARLRVPCAEKLHRALLRDVEAALGLGPLAGEALAEALRKRGVKSYRGLERLGLRRAQLIRANQVGEHELLGFARDVARFEADCREALGRRFGEVE
jgi:hypothetical protein